MEANKECKQINLERYFKYSHCRKIYQNSEYTRSEYKWMEHKQNVCTNTESKQIKSKSHLNTRSATKI